MNQSKFIINSINENVFDWWCPLFKYIPFKPSVLGDALNPKFVIIIQFNYAAYKFNNCMY